MRGGSAGEVAGLQFRERSIDVVGVERDGRCEPAVCVHVEDDQHLGNECAQLLIVTRVADTAEGEALATDRNDGRRGVRDAEVGLHLHTGDLGISTMDSAASDVTAIVRVVIVGQHLRDRVPIAGGDSF